MKKFNFKVRSPVGIHARNALQLYKVAAQFQSEIYIRKEDKFENAKNLISIMTMRIKCGDIILFTIEGIDENYALLKLTEFCKGNL